MKYRQLGNTGLLVSEIALGTMIFGCPSIYYSIPFAIQFFANKKISFIIGVEPILRVAKRSDVMLKKYWLHLLVLVSVFTAVVALLNNTVLNTLYYHTGLFVFAAYAGMMTARFFCSRLKRRL